MSELVALLAAAFAGGLVARAVRVPVLVGFLGAGFALNAAGLDAPEGLDLAADLGVALLLFGIGLKFDLRTLGKREVWATTAIHITATVAVLAAVLAALGALGLPLLDDLELGGLAMLALGLAFSSTVFAIKALEANNATRSFYGVTAIGVLVFQDLVAVAVVTVSTGEAPSPWALALVLFIPARPLLRLALAHTGRGELQVLVAVLLALGPGYVLFDAVGLKGDLGALAIGLLLASDPHAGELRKSLFSVTELLLVAFFLSLGFVGVPGPEHVAIAAILVLLVPLKAMGFGLLLSRFGLRHRSAVLGGLALGNYSEFGLILAVAGVEAGVLSTDLLVTVATAVALSFALAGVATAAQEQLMPRLQRFLGVQDDSALHERDKIIDVAGADAVVLGLGRVGRAAYRHLRDEYGLEVIGVEIDADQVEALAEEGVEVIEADATDPEFWVRLESAAQVDIAILAMPFHGANQTALRRLRGTGFDGVISVIAQYDDDVADARSHGADAVLHLYDGAGVALADEAVDRSGRGEAPTAS